MTNTTENKADGAGANSKDTKVSLSIADLPYKFTEKQLEVCFFPKRRAHYCFYFILLLFYRLFYRHLLRSSFPISWRNVHLSKWRRFAFLLKAKKSSLLVSCSLTNIACLRRSPMPRRSMIGELKTKLVTYAVRNFALLHFHHKFIISVVPAEKTIKDIVNCTDDEVSFYYQRAYFPHPDKEGRPVYVELGGRADVDAMLKISNMDDLIQHHLFTTEVQLLKSFEESSAKAGKLITNCFCIVDMSGMSMSLINANAIKYVPLCLPSIFCRFPLCTRTMFHTYWFLIIIISFL